MSDETSLLVERYKYILSRKEALNASTFKIVTLYQASLATLTFGQYIVLTQAAQNKAVLDLTYNISLAIFVLIQCVSLTALALIFSGIFAWAKYKSEQLIVETYVDPGKWPLPRGGVNPLKWYESYIIVLVLTLLLGSWLAYFRFVFPAIQHLS